MNINKQSLKQFRLSFAEAVKTLESEYEVEVHLKNISYGDVSFHGKVEVTNGANPQEVARNSFEQDLKRYGINFPEITMEHFEKGFMYGGRKVHIVGFKPRSPKYPIVYKDELGGRYKVSYDLVKQVISAQTKGA